MVRFNSEIKHNLVLVLIFFFYPFTALAQFDKLGVESDWYDGKIVLNDNTELKGLIQNNDRLGLFKFKRDWNTPSSEIESFQEKRIVMLEYFDTSSKQNRRFYSFNCNLEEAGFKGAFLFEVLREYKEFAVLSKKTRVSLVDKDNRWLEKYTVNKGLVFEQREGIFCVGQDNKLELLLLISNIEVDYILSDKSKQKTKSFKEVLKKQIEASWEEVENFAKEKRLKFNEREDLLTILDFVKTLEQ